ncbi:UNVERIFIED_CONTAM: hypothetical protein K2H54_050642 [Gekko kuhli]
MGGAELWGFRSFWSWCLVLSWLEELVSIPPGSCEGVGGGGSSCGEIGGSPACPPASSAQQCGSIHSFNGTGRGKLQKLRLLQRELRQKVGDKCSCPQHSCVL